MHTLPCTAQFSVVSQVKMTRLKWLNRAVNLAVSMQRTTESREVESHISGMLKAGLRDQVTPLQVHTIALPLEAS